ncbi:ABC1 kinase family protein [Halobium palmae]|uniref:ABC1 kinase family protein n=1 Tax=Halobium palmae TaxID=1776492 RepID=A0ABD5RWW1_9EURY
MVTLVNLRAYWRFLLVFYQFFPLIVAYARDRRRFVLFGRRRRVDPETRVRRAEILLDSLLTLGPTFIKLGQLLSTRPDILPPEYVDVLSSLQDDVPAAEWSEARQVLEAELGPVDETFDEFDREAISGASLGQVYRATYRGDPVAVKVRRPGIEALVEADLRVVRWSLPIVRRFIGEGRAFSLENLADEFAKTIRQEMDYARERRMLEEIRSNFEGDENIRIPDPYDGVSGPRVLTMEYVDGVKISDVAAIDEMGVDRTALAERLDRIYLQMIVDDGVFHADPHPGNLAVREDGAIVFYDFGMSGRVDSFIQDKIVEFYIAVANQNIDAILDTLIEMGTLSPEADRQVMSDVMELAIADARGEDIETYRVQQIIEQVESTIYEFPLRLPRNLALVLRVATVVEGVCVTLDENFDFVSVATEYLSEEGYREETVKQVVEETADQFNRTAQSLVRVPPKLERVLDRAERGNLTMNVRVDDKNNVFDRLAKRFIYGLLLASGALSTAILYAFIPEDPVPALVAAALTLPFVLLLYRAFKSRSGIRATPQFTRQNLRDRREE